MSKKISEEEFIERVKNTDWSSSKLKWAEPDKLDIIVEKLDKIIELLSPKPLFISPPISKKEFTEAESLELNKTLLDLAKKVEQRMNKPDTRNLVVQRNAKGKLLREGLLNDDMTVEWKKHFS